MSQVATSKEAKRKRPRAEDLALLHALLEALEYDRSLFIKLLHAEFGVWSPRQLSPAYFTTLLEMFLKEAEKQGIETPRTLARKYESLAGRRGMATPAQLCQIDQLFGGAVRRPDREDRGRDLRAYVRKVAGVDALRFLSKTKAARVIAALKSEKRQAGTGSAVPSGYERRKVAL